MTNYKKGDTLSIPKGVYIWRRMNTAEIDAWRQDPSHQGPGEDGESQLRPEMTFIRLPADTQFCVKTARIAAPGNWRTVPKCMTVVAGDDQEYWVERRHLSKE